MQPASMPSVRQSIRDGHEGHSVLDLAFAWLLADPAISSVIAGATRAEQIVANAKTSEWQLSNEEKTEVDAILV